MLARARGVPMVVGLGAIEVDGHSEALVDGDTGAVVLSPGHSQLRLCRDAARGTGRSSGERIAAISTPTPRPPTAVPIDVMINVAAPEELDARRRRAPATASG